MSDSADRFNGEDLIKAFILMPLGGMDTDLHLLRALL